MKKFFTVFTLILVAFTLVACGDKAGGGDENTTSNVERPQVEEKNRVNLSVTDAIEQILTYEFDLTTTKFHAEVDMETHIADYSYDYDYENDEFIETTYLIKTKSKGEVILYGDENLNALLSVDASGSVEMVGENMPIEKVSASGKANLYFVANDAMAYLDVDASYKEGGTEATIKGKYKEAVPFDPSEIPDDIMGDIMDEAMFDPAMIEEMLSNPEVMEVLNNLQGISFYQNGNEFAIKVTLTKELLFEYFGLIGDVDAPEEAFKRFQVELIVSFKDNKLAAIGLTTNILIEQDQNYVKLIASIGITVGVEMPTFPNFNDYVLKDFEEILPEF